MSEPTINEQNLHWAEEPFEFCVIFHALENDDYNNVRSVDYEFMWSDGLPRKTTGHPAHNGKWFDSHIYHIQKSGYYVHAPEWGLCGKIKEDFEGHKIEPYLSKNSREVVYLIDDVMDPNGFVGRAAFTLMLVPLRSGTKNITTRSDGVEVAEIRVGTSIIKFTPREKLEKRLIKTTYGVLYTNELQHLLIGRV